MCLIAFAWQHHALHSLVVAANRDEFYARDTAPLARWPGEPAIFAGRDLEAGGTWMGISETGRFAAVTNFRDPTEMVPHARSRGELVARFLADTASPAQAIENIQPMRNHYRGFNLLLADDTTCMIYESRSNQVCQLTPGVYALSNGAFAANWPKSRFVQQRLSAIIHSDHLEADCLEMLGERAQFDAAMLPNTNISPERERALSAVHVVVPGIYGTRASTVLTRSAHAIAMTEAAFEDGKVIVTTHLSALRQVNIFVR